MKVDDLAMPVQEDSQSSSVLARLCSWLGLTSPYADPFPCQPSVPEDMVVYAIGDIHGELSVLDRLLTKVRVDIKGHIEQDRRPLVVFLGDYVDRGINSCGVLECLSAGPLSEVECRFLLGNHEEAMLDFMTHPTANSAWLGFGGAETLASYGIRPSVGVVDPSRCQVLAEQLMARLPERHRRFLDHLEERVVVGDYAFVHAGIRPGVPLTRQKREDLLWIREPFLSSTRRHPKVIVHGHTIVERPEIMFNRIGIDTGAYATGTLVALVLNGSTRRILES